MSQGYLALLTKLASQGAQPQSARLHQVDTTWRFIEKSLLNYKVKSVPFVVARYSDKIVASLTE